MFFNALYYFIFNSFITVQYLHYDTEHLIRFLSGRGFDSPIREEQYSARAQCKKHAI